MIQFDLDCKHKQSVVVKSVQNSDDSIFLLYLVEKSVFCIVRVNRHEEKTKKILRKFSENFREIKKVESNRRVFRLRA